LHNAVFNKKKRDAVYLPFEVRPEYLQASIEAIRAMGIKGVNVTLPHKEAVFNLVDEVPQDVDRAIGAINTLWLKEDKLFGYNTDGLGFLQDLKDQFDFSPIDKKVLIVGAGGTARAVAFYLGKAGCKDLMIYNRTTERAAGLVDYLQKYFTETKIESITSPKDITGAKLDLVVNATSCGMKVDDPLPMPVEFLDQTSLVYDVVYSPPETRLVKEAQKKKKKACGGLGMLLAQACLSELIWMHDLEAGEVMTIMREAVKV
jgi:shikimate dehydrogenase